MTEAQPVADNRLERRKMRTRAALIRAAQGFIAAGKLNVPVLETTACNGARCAPARHSSEPLRASLQLAN